MGSHYSYPQNDERWRMIDKAAAALSDERDRDPPTSKVLDAALQHLLESIENAERIREEGSVPPEHYRQLSTSVVKLRYRTELEVSR